MTPKCLNICIAVLAILLGTGLTCAEEVVECPSVSLKKVYDKEGLCDGAIGDTASFRLREALLKVGDPRIGIENSYIPDWSTATSVVADGVSTYTFNYRLLDAENQVLQESCQAEMVVTDASKPSCPSSSLKLVVPVGPDCIAVAAEAVDFFEQEVDIEEKGRKPSCEGATLFASISAFKFYDEETHDLIDEGHFKQRASLFARDAALLHVEKGLVVELTYSRAVRTLHVVGIDFKHGLRVHVGLLRRAEILVGHLRVGLLCAVLY